MINYYILFSSPASQSYNDFPDNLGSLSSLCPGKTYSLDLIDKKGYRFVTLIPPSGVVPGTITVETNLLQDLGTYNAELTCFNSNKLSITPVSIKFTINRLHPC